MKLTLFKKTSRIMNFVICGLMAAVIALLLVVKFSGDIRIYLVRSGSMTPAIATGDLIVVGPAHRLLTDNNLTPGQVITYVSKPAANGKKEQMTTHRLVAVDGDKLTVKGDANESADPPISLSQVNGVYWFKVPYVGYANAFIHTKKGWFLSVILPSLALVGLLAWDIVKEAFKPEPVKARASGGGGQS